MKKSLLLPALAIIGGPVIAQPVINSADYSPTSVSQHELKYGVVAFIDPGPSGAAQTWNFSSLSGLSDYPAFPVSCTGNPDCSSFPDATEYIEVDTGKIFYARTATELAEIGVQASSTASTIYSDPYKLIQFPMTYQSSYEDTYASVTQSVPRNGFLKSEIDAYGTLTIPSGTYSDVLRQKLVDSFRMEMGGFAATLKFTQYYWFKANVHHALLTIIISNVNFHNNPELPTPPTVYVAAYLDPGTAGLPEMASLSGSVDVFPNPVAATQDLTVSSNEAGIRRVKLMNLLGQQIKVKDYSNLPQEIKFPLQGDQLSSGMYVLTVETTKGTISRKIFVQK